MAKGGQSIFKPAHARDIFPADELIAPQNVKVYT